MFKKYLLASLTTIALATSLSAQEKTESGLWVDGFRWDSGSSYTYIVFRAINNNGKIAICGSYYTKGTNKMRRLSEEVMENYRLGAGNQHLMNDISFMQEVRTEDELGTVENCRATYVDWYAGANDQLVSRVNKRTY